MDTGRERQRKSLELKLPKPLLIKFSVSWLPSCSLLIFYTFDQYRLAEIFPFLEKKRFAFQYVLWLLTRPRVGAQTVFHLDESYPEEKKSLLELVDIIGLWCNLRGEL